MKVAFLAYDLSEGSGWGRYTVQIVKRLARLGVDPLFFTIRGSAPSPIFPKENQFPILRSYLDDWGKPAGLARDVLALRPLVRDCAALHCMVEPYLPIGYLLAGKRHLFGAAVGTYTIQTLGSRWAPLYRAAFRRCDAILSISRYTGMRLAEALPAVVDRVKVVPLGVEIDPAREIQPLSAREKAFLTVGEVKPRKGVLESVRALARVAQHHPGVRYYIVGAASPGPYVDSIKREAARLGIEANVVWKGRVAQAELDQLYAKARGFVLPSLNAGGHFEGFGLVHLEANALGVPAIGSLDCGNEDAIQDGVSGFLVKQGDIEALAAAMRRLLDGEVQWDALSRSSQEFAREMSWERTVEGYLEAYRAAGLRV